MTTKEKDLVLEQCILAKQASRELATFSAEKKNKILKKMADALEKNNKAIYKPILSIWKAKRPKERLSDFWIVCF
jgi:acyl-CoA reductase-like NAD-dependent aldehyde dehydrogenase